MHSMDEKLLDDAIALVDSILYEVGPDFANIVKEDVGFSPSKDATGGTLYLCPPAPPSLHDARANILGADTYSWHHIPSPAQPVASAAAQPGNVSSSPRPNSLPRGMSGPFEGFADADAMVHASPASAEKTLHAPPSPSQTPSSAAVASPQQPLPMASASASSEQDTSSRRLHHADSSKGLPTGHLLSMRSRECLNSFTQSASPIFAPRTSPTAEDVEGEREQQQQQQQEEHQRQDSLQRQESQPERLSKQQHVQTQLQLLKQQYEQLQQQMQMQQQQSQHERPSQQQQQAPSPSSTHVPTTPSVPAKASSSSPAADTPQAVQPDALPTKRPDGPSSSHLAMAAALLLTTSRSENDVGAPHVGGGASPKTLPSPRKHSLVMKRSLTFLPSSEQEERLKTAFNKVKVMVSRISNSKGLAKSTSGQDNALHADEGEDLGPPKRNAGSIDFNSGAGSGGAASVLLKAFKGVGGSGGPKGPVAAGHLVDKRAVSTTEGSQYYSALLAGLSKGADPAAVVPGSSVAKGEHAVAPGVSPTWAKALEVAAAEIQKAKQEAEAAKIKDYQPHLTRGRQAQQERQQRAHGGPGGTTVAGEVEEGGLMSQKSGELKAWSNKSAADVVRLGVRLIQATELSRTNENAEVDPFAIVMCERHQCSTKAVAKSKDPYWDEFYVFEITSPAFAVLKVKVFDHVRCWRPALMGELRIPVKNIADFPIKWNTPTWQQLRSRGGKPMGQVQLQLYYLAERVHRPLHVMCCTWNVGNAEPCEDLSQWLSGADKLEHDIIAIGVQECSYKTKGLAVPDDDELPEGGVLCDPNSEYSVAAGSVYGGRIGRSAHNLQHLADKDWDGTGTPRSRRSSNGSVSSELPQARCSSDGTPANAQQGTRDTQQGGPAGPGGPPSQVPHTPRAFVHHHSRLGPLVSNSGTSSAMAPEGRRYSASNLPANERLSALGPGGAFAVETPTPSITNPNAQRRNYYKSRTVGDMGGVQFRDVWEDTLKSALGSSYWMVRSVHMGQIRLLVFARNDIYAAISRVEKGSQATGVAGVATNKGGVAIGLRVWDTEICFVNSHLAAHQDKTKARNTHYRDIVKGIRMDPYQMDVLTAYHHVFWMGDLNYRLDYGQQAVNPTDSPLPCDFEEMVHKIETGEYSELLTLDQLAREMKEKRAFLGFSEGAIEFPPTFKVQRRRGLKYLPQRSPAWCDRILHRSNLPLKQAKPLDYFCAPDVTSSDHKPVSAVFSVPTVWRRSNLDATNRVNISLVLTSLSCKGLFMLRKRKSSSMASTLPNPQVIFKGPCLQAADETFKTTTVKQSRDPVWDESMLLVLKSATIQDAAHYRLMIRVVDVGEGNRVVAGTQNTLARGVLPLTEAANMLAARGTRTQFVTSNVQLEYNGQPAGTMTVVMRLQVIEERKRPQLGHGSVANIKSLMRKSVAHVLKH